MARFVSLLLCASVFIFAASKVRGAERTCAGLRFDDLHDGDLFVLDSSPEEWKQFTSFEAFTARSRGAISFNYVVKTLSPKGRSGAIVIKSAKRGADSSGDSPTNTTVLLYRNDAWPGARCRTSAFLSDGVRIPFKDYSDFHDYGFFPSIQSLTALKGFHIAYETQSGTCRSTDDTATDSFFDSRSNRSQFSFDRQVVDRGTHSQITAILPRAFGPSELTDLRSEIRRYKTDRGLACIRFEILNLGPDHFLRVNDLEAKLEIPPFRRRQESRWD